MDPFEDIFSPTQTNARAGAKFQPKVKQRPREPTTASAPPFLPCDQTNYIGQCFDSGPSILGCKDEIPKSSSLAQITRSEAEDFGFRAPENEFDDRFVDEELASSNGTDPVPGLDTEASSLLGDARKLSSENVDIFFLDNFGPQTTNNRENEGSKSESKADMGVKYMEKVLTLHRDSVSRLETETRAVEDFITQTHCSFDTTDFAMYDVVPPQICSEHEEVPVDNGKLETEVTDTFFSFETCEGTGVNGQRSGKFNPRPKLGKGKDKSNTVDHQAEAGSSLPSETMNLDQSTEECIHDDSIPEFPIELSDGLGHGSEEPTNFTEAMCSQGADFGVTSSEDNLGDVTRTEEISTGPNCLRKSKRSSRTIYKEVESKKSSRQMKKWLRQIVDEPVAEDQTSDDSTYEPQSTSNGDEDEDNDNDDEEENSVGISSRKRKAPKKSKEPLSGNDKPAPKRKNSNKANDKSTKESPRKKFSRSSCSNKRTVDKALLDIPEEEIDTQRLPIKDLILLAEHRERMMIKDTAAKLKTEQNNKSADGSLQEDGSNNEEEALSEHGQNSDEEQPHYESTALYVNYQTYMNKTPASRWSKLDTELFYEAVRQFGTDFSMIQQLFPNRTRHQIKLKFKTEARRHPQTLSEAATNRSKDHSYFESVIERLKQASVAKHESFGTEEEEAEDTGHDTNNGATKPEQNDETMKEQEADVVEVQNSPLKSYDSDGDDDLDQWNQYNY